MSSSNELPPGGDQRSRIVRAVIVAAIFIAVILVFNLLVLPHVVSGQISKGTDVVMREF